MALKGSAKPLSENEAAAKTQIQDQTVPAAEDLPWKEEEVSGETQDSQPSANAPVPAAPATGTAVSAARAPGSFLAKVGQEDDGFSALDDQIGFGSFPMAKLDKNTFVIENSEYTELLVIMLQARSKWILKVDDENFVYSYDNVNDLSGKSLEQVKREWRAQGLKDSTTSMYMEVAARVLSEGKHQGKLVLLNVAPASVKRLGGYRAELAIQKRTLSQVVTRIFPGALIKINPKISFHPWNFEFSRDVTEDDMT